MPEARTGAPGGLRSALLRLVSNRAMRSLARAMAVGIGVMVVSFFLVRIIPGDPVQILLGDLATPELIAHYREMLGLNGTMLQQFATYVGRLLRGDLGTSVITGQRVSSVVARTMPISVWLIGVTIVMALVLALPLGVVAALYRRTRFGQLFRIVTSVLLATPVFFSGLLLLLFFAIRLGWAPVAGYTSRFPANLKYLWLPALTMCCVQVPILARVLQSSIADTMEQEFVETAVVRGLSWPVFTWRYLLRPSLAPTISLLGYVIGQLLGATVMVEIVFNIPGLGTALIVEGVLQRDYTLVQSIVLIFGLIVVGVSYVADTVSAWLDPRTRTQ